jgi:hypothetical protein
MNRLFRAWCILCGGRDPIEIEAEQQRHLDEQLVPIDFNGKILLMPIRDLPRNHPARKIVGCQHEH